MSPEADRRTLLRRLSFDLTWTGLHEPYLEDRIIRISNGRTVYDRTNYDQCCEVTGTITAQDRGDKTLVFKFKRKKQYKRTIGHRQNYTQVEVSEILA